jgi:predicted ThiF/HesA family dinucleotide-utilizing enzyme
MVKREWRQVPGGACLPFAFNFTKRSTQRGKRSEEVMGFKAVWGFGPEEVAQARKASTPVVDHLAAHEAMPELNLDTELGARVPSSIAAQIYELRRMFQL